MNNEAESREAQKLFFELGYKIECFVAAGFPRFVATTNHGEDYWYSTGFPLIALLDGFKELTLPQLRDLVVLHRNDVNDATHVTEDNEVYYLKTSVWNVWKSGWHHSENDESWFEDNVIPIKKSEQGLISGADALRALAENKNVQCSIAGKNDWTVDILTITPYYFIGMGSGQFQFRLKPSTIKIELEIPAPFEPKDGDKYYRLAPIISCGYTECYSDEDCESQFGAWRTEEEIKQVVAALRGIKG